MIVNDSSFRQEQVFVFFTEINTITNEARQNKSRIQRETGNCDRGREGFCANLLCNVWQHACMFVVVFHTDNHVLTHSKWRNILHCLHFLLILTKNVAYVSMVCSVFLKKIMEHFWPPQSSDLNLIESV